MQNGGVRAREGARDKESDGRDSLNVKAHQVRHAREPKARMRTEKPRIRRDQGGHVASDGETFKLALGRIARARKSNDILTRRLPLVMRTVLLKYVR